MRRLATLLLTAVAVLALAGIAHSIEQAPNVPDPRTATFEEADDYYQFGNFRRDTGRLGRIAKRALNAQLDKLRKGKKPAIVFDIDDTALSTYECQRRLGEFGGTELTACVVAAGAETTTGTGKGLPRIEPVYELFQKARKLGVHIFFITGRPDSARAASIENLFARGYRADYELTTFPSALPETSKSLIPYKSAARQGIEKRGFEILLNVGDQLSDLRGGFSNRRILIPNPMYFTR